MFLGILSLAFSSLLILLAPFAVLAVYIFACLVLRHPISNLAVSVTSILAVIVAALHFAIAVLAPTIGMAATVYIVTTAVLLCGSLVDDPLQKIKGGVWRVRGWIRPDCRA